MKLQSDFALLDVKRGRRQLDKMVERNGMTGAAKHDLPKPIPVVIRGYITHRYGSDDGVSQEWGVDVSSVEVLDAE